LYVSSRILKFSALVRLVDAPTRPDSIAYLSRPAPTPMARRSMRLITTVRDTRPRRPPGEAGPVPFWFFFWSIVPPRIGDQRVIPSPLPAPRRKSTCCHENDTAIAFVPYEPNHSQPVCDHT